MYHDAIERGLESGIQAAVDIEAREEGLVSSIDVIKITAENQQSLPFVATRRDQTLAHGITNLRFCSVD